MSLLLFAPFQPTPGLAIWSAVIFLIFWFMMSRLAFKPITQALKKREDDIQTALDEAKKAKEEMSNLKAENNQLLQQAREERAAMLNEAKETKNNIIAQAKEKAKADVNKIVSDARVEIENQKFQKFPFMIPSDSKVRKTYEYYEDKDEIDSTKEILREYLLEGYSY